MGADKRFACPAAAAWHSKNPRVVQQPGPPSIGPGHPLRLSKPMRTRLKAAVRALLDNPGLANQPDAVRLAAVVLLGKSRIHDGHTFLRSEELARWLGVSRSYVQHTVLPALRGSGAVLTRVITDTRGRPVGLDCVLTPTRRAAESGDGRHPLLLSRPQLATLLRLCEAVFGPGWQRRDRLDVPPGLLADRTGKGAPTDRLALLLLVLETRADGWVRHCGGVVDTRRGRPAATVGRLMSRTAAAGEKILRRLRGVVEVVRQETPSGLLHTSRIHLPAVAAAHRNQAQHPESVLQLGKRSTSDPAARVAGQDTSHLSLPTARDQRRRGERRGLSDPAVAADLHTPHASVVAISEPTGGDLLISGDSRGGAPIAAGSARTRERCGAMPDAVCSAMSPAGRPAAALLADLPLSRCVRSVLVAVQPVVERLNIQQALLVSRAVERALTVVSDGWLGRYLEGRLASLSSGSMREAVIRLRDPMGWLLAQLPTVTLCPRCRRSRYGRASALPSLCDRCRSREASASPRARCARCERAAVLSAQGECSRCEARSAVAAAAEEAVALLARHAPVSAASAEKVRAEVSRVASAAARQLAAAGAVPAVQHAGARLAAESHVASLRGMRRPAQGEHEPGYRFPVNRGVGTGPVGQPPPSGGFQLMALAQAPQPQGVTECARQPVRCP